MTSSTSRQGVLLVNLGSPDSTRVADVKRYQREFLMDEYVIDAPYPLRKLIVEGFILPFRARRSAEAYDAIWSPEGSPLLVHSRRLLEKLQAELDMPVALGMRYGNPSIRTALQQLIEQEGVERLLLIPLYPHYALATFKTVVEKTRAVLAELNARVQLDILPPFYDEPAYIESLAVSAAPFIKRPFDHLLFSYHGVPERHLKKADPTGSHCLRSPDCCRMASPAHSTCYRHQVFRTTEALAQALRLPRERYSVAFQSRLGIDRWLQPNTADEITRLACSGVKTLLVMCPAFTADCLETLEEIGMRGKEAFLQAGGEHFELIPCLNDHLLWIQTLKIYCKQNFLSNARLPQTANLEQG